MDEILASIRRIIENGDDRPGLPGFPPRAVPSRSNAEPAGEQRSPSELMSEMARLDVGEEAGSEAEPVPPVAAERRPSLEVIANPSRISEDGVPEIRSGEMAAERLRAASRQERGEPEESGEIEASAAVPRSPVGNENAPELSRFVANDASSAEAPHDFSIEFDEADFAEALRDETGIAPKPGTESLADIFRDEPEEPEAASGARILTGASALLSAEAGAQVASAFDDLARAIREGQMRSMEDMAREMLRPMLQEWLDDNLPRLVERLVREEIERVARGPRR